jgi:hypothetical protein
VTPRKLRNNADEIPGRIFLNYDIKSPLHN